MSGIIPNKYEKTEKLFKNPRRRSDFNILVQCCIYLNCNKDGALEHHLVKAIGTGQKSIQNIINSLEQKSMIKRKKMGAKSFYVILPKGKKFAKQMEELILDPNDLQSQVIGLDVMDLNQLCPKKFSIKS